jgi:MraZ protein
MLLGEYEYTVDDRGRSIPARLREPFKPGWCSPRPALHRGLPYGQWQDLAQQMRSLPPNSLDARRWRRATFPSAFQVELDRQGRVLLPQTLREYADIGTDVVIAGMFETLEIWSRQAWRVEQALLREHGARIAEAVSLPVGQTSEP